MVRGDAPRSLGADAAQGALAGALASASLWAIDFLSASKLQFAGVGDRTIQARISDSAATAMKVLEAELCLIHVLAGALVGAGAVVAWTSAGLRRRSWGRAVPATVPSALFVLGASALALLSTVARYPQLYVDRWWLGGGTLRSLQRVTTHLLGAELLDAVCLAALSLPALGLAIFTGRLVRKGLPSLGARAIAPAAAAIIVLSLIGASLVYSPGRRSPSLEPNVLIIAVDSMRMDRLEAKMPHLRALLSRGALFRSAFTSIARTFPSWVSALTGREPRETGVRTMFPSVRARRDVGATLFSALRDEDYRTFVISDFAGDIFPRFKAGFDIVDAPPLTVDDLAQATLLAAHTWSLPFLRVRVVRDRIGAWRNLPSLADPEWLADKALERVDALGKSGEPFAGLVFFSTAHFPYAAPYPFYLDGDASYEGPYLYHVPATAAGAALVEPDVRAIRARYDGALRAIDEAVDRLIRGLEQRRLLERTLVVVTADHGEELYEVAGLAGHGDVVGAERSQRVPLFLMGPGAPAGYESRDQVRLYDLPATILSAVLRDRAGHTFGEGASLFDDTPFRPICVESGIWFWPNLPVALRGARLEYDDISKLLEVSPETREIVLKEENEVLVETAKERGVILGHRWKTRRLGPDGLITQTGTISGVTPAFGDVDLDALFEERCVAGDARLESAFDAVLFEPRDGETR